MSTGVGVRADEGWNGAMGDGLYGAIAYIQQNYTKITWLGLGVQADEGWNWATDDRLYGAIAYTKNHQRLLE